MKLHDSGEREEWETGSKRDCRTGKGRLDLLPPDAILAVAKVYEAGAAKYGDRNWEQGQPLMRYMDSALRHLMRALRGDHDEPHVAMAAWNLLGYLQTLAWIESQELPVDLDDRPDRMHAL